MTEIEEGNKNIAEFMDADILYLPPTGMYQNRSISDKCSRYEELVIKYKYKAILKYHSSWDCLMPVISKICSLSYNESNHRFQSSVDVDLFFDNDIIPVWKNVVNFINWHNENT